LLKNRLWRFDFGGGLWTELRRLVRGSFSLLRRPSNQPLQPPIGAGTLRLMAGDLRAARG